MTLAKINGDNDTLIKDKPRRYLPKGSNTKRTESTSEVSELDTYTYLSDAKKRTYRYAVKTTVRRVVGHSTLHRGTTANRQQYPSLLSPSKVQSEPGDSASNTMTQL